MVHTRACLACFILLLSPSTWAIDRRGRLGIGVSNELDLGVPLFSLKLQKSRSFALGGLVGFNTAEKTGTFGAGFKLYHNIFQEPPTTLLLGFSRSHLQKEIIRGDSADQIPQ